MRRDILINDTFLSTLISVVEMLNTGLEAKEMLI